MNRAILDDHLLRDLLADDVPAELDEILAEHEPATTNHYLFRLCKSVVSPAESLDAPLCVWSGDDDPGIRAAMARLRQDYRTVDRRTALASPAVAAERILAATGHRLI